MEDALVHNQYLLEKFPGKGGWTFAAIPEIKAEKKMPFGWVKVKGKIDTHEIKNYHLMPMGNGQLFLPVKADIRKKIGKKAGDFVSVILFADTDPVEIPEPFLACLMDDPAAHEQFLTYPDGEKKTFINWIFSAKTEETRVKRIVKTIEKLVKRKKFMDR